MNRQTVVSWVVLGLGGIWILYRLFAGKMVTPWSARGLGLWCAAFLTLAILSFLYRDNPVYKFSEHLFIGVSAAYWMVQGFWTTIVPNLIGKLFPAFTSRHFIPGLKQNEAEWFYLVPLVFGFLLLARLLPAGGWISRWTLAFIVGITAGLRFIAYLESDFIAQVRASMIPVVVYGNGALDIGASITALVMTLGVLAGLVYFFFSKEHKGVFGAISRVGIWILMITFGAGFGYTVMGRIALLIGRFEFLLRDWLKTIA